MTWPSQAQVKYNIECALWFEIMCLPARHAGPHECNGLVEDLCYTSSWEVVRTAGVEEAAGADHQASPAIGDGCADPMVVATLRCGV